jgi:DNA-binding FadR family transcriptional regulator
LLRSLGALTTSFALLGNYTRLISGRAEQARREHSAIVEAIATREPARAEQAARAHIRSAQEARLKEVARAAAQSDAA